MVKIVKIIICMCLISLLTVPVFAEEKTQAELLQEMLAGDMTGNGEEPLAEPDFNTDYQDSAVPDFNSVDQNMVDVPSEPTVTTDELNVDATATIIELVNRISELDSKQPDLKEVETLMDMYNSLSDIDKLSVNNYDKLKEAEDTANANYEHENPTPTPDAEEPNNQTQIRDDPDVHTSSKYLVTIKEPMSIVVRFTEDENNDNLIDIPTFTLLGPGGLTYMIDQTKLEIRDTNLDLTCSWTDRDFVQFDIKEATPGQWQFSSSLTCTYEKHEYLGPIKPLEPVVTPQPDEPTPMPKQSYGRAIVIGIVIVVGILLMVAVILVMNKVDILSPIMNPIKNLKSTPSKPKGKYMNDDDDYGASLTDEQIMAQIKKEYEEQKAKEEMQEEAMQEQVQEKYEKENELTDDHMYETRFDYDDDEEELDEEELGEQSNDSPETKKSRPVRFS